MSGRVLVISYYFPPLGGVGVQRTLKYVKYLPGSGWQPIVVTPARPAYTVRDASLLDVLAPDLEVYSIDESFIRVEHLQHLYGGSVRMGQAIRARLRRWTGLPVCVGFGETKTLAKFANHLAKKNAGVAATSAGLVVPT